MFCFLGILTYYLTEERLEIQSIADDIRCGIEMFSLMEFIFYFPICYLICCLILIMFLSCNQITKVYYNCENY